MVPAGDACCCSTKLRGSSGRVPSGSCSPHPAAPCVPLVPSLPKATSPQSERWGGRRERRALGETHGSCSAGGGRGDLDGLTPPPGSRPAQVVADEGAAAGGPGAGGSFRATARVRKLVQVSGWAGRGLRCVCVCVESLRAAVSSSGVFGRRRDKLVLPQRPPGRRTTGRTRQRPAKGAWKGPMLLPRKFALG